MRDVLCFYHLIFLWENPLRQNEEMYHHIFNIKDETIAANKTTTETIIDFFYL